MIGPNTDVHFANKPVLVDGPSLFPARQLGRLGPHLLYVLEDHVAVAVKGLDARQQLAVIADRDEDLGVAADGGLEDGQGAGREFICHCFLLAFSCPRVPHRLFGVVMFFGVRRGVCIGRLLVLFDRAESFVLAPLRSR